MIITSYRDEFGKVQHIVHPAGRIADARRIASIYGGRVVEYAPRDARTGTPIESRREYYAPRTEEKPNEEWNRWK